MRDLKAYIPGASNFRYGEFVKSEVAIRKGIENLPNEEQWKCIEKLAVNILQPVRNRFGRIRITSGFRSVELCLEIGSSKNSNHARGQAADIEPYDVNTPLIDVIEFIHVNLEYRELIAEYFPGGWIHVAYREGGNSKMLKLKDKDNNYDIVTIGYLRHLYGR